MFRVISCLTTQHDFRLVVLAAAICVTASLAAFSVYGQAVRRSGVKQLCWIIFAALSAGSGIWATHFVAMLAYNVGPPTGFAPFWTSISLLLAVLISFFGFLIAAAGKTRWDYVTGGATLGLGIGAMHYSGMAALLVAGSLRWNVLLIAVSIFSGAGLSSAAMLAFNKGDGPRALLKGAALLTLATCSLHFVGMGAAEFVPDPRIAVPPSVMDHTFMAISVAVATALAMMVGFVAVFLDNHWMRNSSAGLSQLAEAAIEEIVIASGGRILNANSRLAEMSGHPLEALVGSKVVGGLITLESGSAISLPEGDAVEASLMAADGGLVPVEVLKRPISVGAAPAEVYAIRDLRERKAAAVELKGKNDELDEALQHSRHQNMRFAAALQHMSQGLCMFDADWRIVVCNERYASMYELSAPQTAPGTHLREVIAARVANGFYSGDSGKEYLRTRLITPAAAVDTIEELNDGRIIAISRRPMPDGGWVTTHEDISERRRIEDRVAYLAHHDALTDLPNRVLFRERLEESLRECQALAVLVLDLDRFKEVNDTLGHAIGDALLRSVAARLRTCVRSTDTVARTGGDEFAIIETSVTSPAAAAALAKRIHAALTAPFDLEGHSVVVGTSIGIALAPQDAIEPLLLMKNADLALYRAKSESRGVYRFFEPGMDQRMQARRNLERDLRFGLLRNEFELYYQPLVNLETNAIAGFEALMRWNQPERGRVSPGDFIPLAEETGLIIPMGEWALRQACIEAATWPNGMKVAVNVSVAQFKSRNLVSAVIGALAASGLSPHRLEMEITESVMLHGSDSALATLRQLHQLGVRISLDDFGTGYSSLSYLRSFPFDKIKIDRSFVSDMTSEEGSFAIVRAISRLGLSLGIETTAEGVETKEQLDRVKAEGCTEMQGYYFSPPKPAFEIRKLFEAALEAKAA